nr:expressed conserved protein [Hymenolepis microstoma]
MPEKNAAIELLREAEYIAPGQRGTIRSSMFKNELLRRAPLGRPLVRGRSLPPSCFIYGKRNEHDPNGLNKCLTWSKFKPSPGVGLYGVDYVRMNKESAKAGIHTMSEWIKFRKEKDYHHSRYQRFNQKVEFPVEMTFGIRNPQTSNINCLLSHYYKREYDRKAIEANLPSIERLAEIKSKTPPIYDTLKSTHSVVPLPQSKSQPTKLWTMKRFQSQPSRISTYWNEEECKKFEDRCKEEPECALKV